MKFSDITGHEAVKQRLRRMAESGRLPHALLLEGPAGVGKLAMARAFVQYNNCAARTPEGEPCGHCPSCLQMQNFNHIDTIYSFPVVKPDGSQTAPVSDDFLAEWRSFLNADPYADFDTWVRTFNKPNARPVIYVTESNDLIHKLSFSSRTVRYRTVILWLPERMNEETANKLLKMIEEPYPDTLILMVSNEPKAILPTIYSRLQRIRMSRLSDDEVAGVLMRRDGLGADDARAIAHLAEGSMTAARKALSVSATAREDLERFIQLMRLAYVRDAAKLRDWANDLAGTGREAELRFYAYAARMVRESFMSNFHNPSLSFMNTAESAFVSRFGRFITVANAPDIITTFEDAATDIAGNANGKLVNFDVAVKMMILLKKQA